MQYFKDIWTTLFTIAKGMKVTMAHLLFWDNITVNFPEEKRALPPRFRGVLHNDIELCIGCLLCAKACPVDCIHIKCEGKGKDRWVAQFDIDVTKCMWCELCVEACPDTVKSLTMTPEYELSAFNQEDMILKFGKGPMKVKPATAAGPPPAAGAAAPAGPGAPAGSAAPKAGAAPASGTPAAGTPPATPPPASPAS